MGRWETAGVSGVGETVGSQVSAQASGLRQA